MKKDFFKKKFEITPPARFSDFFNYLAGAVTLFSSGLLCGHHDFHATEYSSTIYLGVELRIGYNKAPVE